MRLKHFNPSSLRNIANAKLGKSNLKLRVKLAVARQNYSEAYRSLGASETDLK